MNDKISIIVPVYNVEKYLKRCIESIQNQSYQNLDIILVNDGSTDNCGKICDEYAGKDDRIVVIHKDNGGLSDARNRGIEVATGSYIGFVDSDDTINPLMYEILYQNLLKENCDISVCRLNKTKKDNFIISKSNNTLKLGKEQALMSLLEEDDLISNVAWNKLYKRELFEKITFPIGKKFEDIYTTYKVFEQITGLVFTDYIGYNYIQRSDSITGTLSKQALRDELEAVEERYHYLLSKYPQMEEKLRINKASFIYKIEKLAIKSNEKEFFYKLIEPINFYQKEINKQEFKQAIQKYDLQNKILANIFRKNLKLFYKITDKLYKMKNRSNKWKV